MYACAGKRESQRHIKRDRKREKEMETETGGRETKTDREREHNSIEGQRACVTWESENCSVSAACGTIKNFNEGQTFINFFFRELDIFYLDEKIKTLCFCRKFNLHNLSLIIFSKTSASHMVKIWNCIIPAN